MRRTLKRTQRSTKIRVEPTRLAVAALERIKTVHRRKGHAERFGPPIIEAELADRARLMRRPLPPSYDAAMRVSGSIGEEEQLLDADGMARERAHTGNNKLFPFSRRGDVLFCFDLRNGLDVDEPPVVEEAGGAVRASRSGSIKWRTAVKRSSRMRRLPCPSRSARSWRSSVSRSTIPSLAAWRRETSPRSRSSSAASWRPKCAGSTTDSSTRAAGPRSCSTWTSSRSRARYDRASSSSKQKMSSGGSDVSATRTSSATSHVRLRILIESAIYARRLVSLRSCCVSPHVPRG